MPHLLRFFFSALVLVSCPLAARAADDAVELKELRAQVQLLEQQLKAVMRQLDIKEQAAAAAASTAPVPPAATPTATPTPASAAAAVATSSAPAKVSVNDRGYAFSSADDATTLQFHVLFHLDARVFIHDGPGIVNNTLNLRRARLIADGTLAKRTSYQFVTEFGGSAVSILDANFGLRLTDTLQLKLGKFKTPIGLEVMQSDAATSFTERSILSGFLPNRDLGIQLGGTLLGSTLAYSVGVFNGVADGATSNNVDFDEDKDLVGRIVATPFKQNAASLLRGLLIGVGASEGRQKTAAGHAAAYRTDGQQVFFSYNPGVVADGRTWRVSPQLDYRLGSFGLLGEYVVSAANLRATPLAPKTEVRHRGWQLTSGYVLTGESSTYGPLVPRTDFNPAAGTWGAFEVTGRFAEMHLDDNAFPALASPGAAANKASGYAAGLKWYLSKAVAFKFDYYHTDFELSPLAPPVPTAPVLRQDENAFVTRFQLAF